MIKRNRWVWAGVLAVVALTARPVSSDAQAQEAERWLDGSQPFSLGVDTSRFRVSTLGTRPVIGTEDPALSSAPYRLIDTDLLGTAISFDLKLRWPSASGASAFGSLAPYLSFGPTVLFPGAELVSRSGPPGSRSEGPMALGLSWGAGLSWRFIERPLLEQGVAPGEQKGVPVTPFHRLQQNFPLVDADPDRPNDPAPAQLLKRTVATFTKGAHDPEMRLCAMLLCTDVVYVENIDPSQAESLQTILERSDDPLVRVVKHAIERHWRRTC